MLKDIAITDLTKFVEFTYWPMREGLDDTMEQVQDRDAKDIVHYAVFGKFYIPGQGEAEEWVADFGALHEAAGYALMLNTALKGKAEDLNQYRIKT